MDRRLTPANGRAALRHLHGKVEAASFTDGEAARVAVPVADLLKAPEGARDRQLLWGEAVTLIDRHQGWCFLQAAKDGFCGYLRADQIAAPRPATHWVATPGTHLLTGPKVQCATVAPLFMGAQLQVIGQSGSWSETLDGFVPSSHLKPLGSHPSDPASVAQSFLHSPYLWGGNSRAGIDCSGLAQIAFGACGFQIPGDSDLQAACGSEIPAEAPLQRNDLLFWKGHVAIALSADRMIHATGAAMAVIEEDIPAAIARIFAAGDGPVTARRRLPFHLG